MYMTTEEVKEIRKRLKKHFKNCRLSVTSDHGFGVRIELLAGDIDVGDIEYKQLSARRPERYSKPISNFIEKCIEIIESVAGEFSNQNADDPSADYPDYTYSRRIQIGAYDKPYVQKLNG